MSRENLRIKSEGGCLNIAVLSPEHGLRNFERKGNKRNKTTNRPREEV